MSERQFKFHAPCEACGSSNNLAVYDDGYASCFSMGCDFYTYNYAGQGERTGSRSGSFKMSNLTLIDKEIRAIKSRGLSEATCNKFGYGFGSLNDGTKVHVYDLYDKKLNVIGQKTRDAQKNFKFIYEGNDKNNLLFGQNVWSAGGKLLVITEGEIDAMSVSQIRNNTWPAVSVTKGAGAAKKEVQNNIDFVASFEKVVIMFDMDEAGKIAAKEVAEVLPAGKAFIAKLPLKDANACMLEGESKAVVSAIFEAKEYRPDGIISGKSITKEELKKASCKGKDYPYPKMNAMLLGHRPAELTLVTAGSGIGKSTFVTELKNYLMVTTNEKFGNIYLEEKYFKTAQRDVALVNNVPLGLLRLNPDIITDEEWDAGMAFVHLQEYYDHFGSLESKRLLAQMEYLAIGCGCGTIVLDHISMVVSGMEEKGSSERKDIDVLMTNMRSLVERTGVHILAIVHLKRADGKTSFNEGGQVSLTDLRGSASLEQLSDNIIALERNQQDEDIKNLVQIRILKNREFGETGLADLILYERDTGRLRLYEGEVEESYDKESVKETIDEIIY